MAASTRFEYSHESHNIRYSEATSIKQLCENLIQQYNETKSYQIPLLISLYSQSWKPGKSNITSWASGTAYLTNTMYVNEYVENTLAILVLYGWQSPSYTIYEHRGIIWWGKKSDYSDAYITWSE